MHARQPIHDRIRILASAFKAVHNDLFEMVAGFPTLVGGWRKPLQ